MRTALLGSLLLIAAGLCFDPASAERTTPDLDPLLARGRYLVVIGACNDCHTPMWRDSDGNVALSSWMIGSQIGLRQAWGTEYPINVRQWFHEITEDQWLFSVRTRGGRMQWHDLRHLTLDDQRAIYRFVRSIGPSSARVPEDVPASREPRTPYIDLRLHTPAPQQSQNHR